MLKQSRHLRTPNKKLYFKFYIQSLIQSSPKRARNKRNGKEPIAASSWNCIMGLKENRLNDSSGSSHVRKDAQTKM